MRFTVKNESPAIAAQLNLLAAKLHNTRPVMAAVAAMVDSATRKRFETRSDPQGREWAEWSDATRAARERRKTDEKGGILEESGLLRNITRRVSARSAVIGTPMPYGVYHQTGTVKMPARVIFGLSEQDEKDIGKLLQEWLEKK